MSLTQELLAILATRPGIAILTGAGLSAESGVPTFREAQSGLWAKFSPQELATPEAFADNPQRVWDWYRWRRELVSRAEPNPAHLAIAELEAGLPCCQLVTQNVDGLLQRAGARQVTELHGNLWRQKCAAGCGAVQTVNVPGHDALPRCQRCNALMRPDVVWFGETLSQAALADAGAAIKAAGIVIVCGTSNLVYPAAALPLEALRMGKTVVEINPARTPLSSNVPFYIGETASNALPAIAQELLQAST